MTLINRKYVGKVLIMTALVALCACSSAPTQSETEKTASSGPTVLYARTEPGTIELNRDFQPLKTPLVIADVKDFNSRVTDVKLQFSNIPLEVPMKNVEGSTWRAEFTPRQIEMLAVSGKTTKYEAQVIAKNEDGQISMSQNPIEVAVKAPDIGSAAG